MHLTEEQKLQREQEKANLRHFKEQKELARLEKQGQKAASFMRFFWVIVVVVSIIYIADEIASNLPQIMRPYMIFDLFNIPNAGNYNEAIRSDEYANAISKMSIATIPTYIITMLLPLYKMLPDRFGRKVFLVINTVGMGVGMLICMISQTYIMYVLGMVITGFFTPNDMQVIYILEVSPQKHRAKLCSITKVIGLLSVSLIGVLKTVFYDSQVLNTWKGVFIIPVIITIVIGLSCIILTKETPVYVNNRKAYLMKTDEERKAEAEASKVKNQNGGIKAAWKYIIASRQLRWVCIVLIIFQFAVGIKGWETETMLAFGQSVEQNNLFLIIEPIVYAIYAFFSGFISDWVGRKKACIIFGVCATIGQAAFILIAKNDINATVFLAIANGLMYGGLWSLSDCLYLTIPAESTPTGIRSSVAGLITYTGGVGMIVGVVLGVLFDKIGSANIGTFQLFTFVPIMVVSIVLLMLKVKETKNFDINKVEEELHE